MSLERNRLRFFLIRAAFAIAVFWTAQGALAAVDLKSYKARLTESSPPTVLFRWINPTFLKESSFSNAGALRSLPKVEGSQYVQSVRDLVKLFSNRVAFTWIDPVLGSHGVLHEHYGGTRAVLMVFEIDPAAVAVRFIHPSDDQKPLQDSVETRELKSADLIEHVTPELHEWIIVNPKVIRAYTFDPKITFPLWKEFFRPYYKNPDYVPPIENIHFRGKGEDFPVWGESNWDKSIFFGDQIFAFNVTSGHPWFGKVEKLETWNKSSPLNLRSGNLGRGDTVKFRELFCDGNISKEITPKQAMDWWQELRK